jgi:hypothetical protein
MLDIITIARELGGDVPGRCSCNHDPQWLKKEIEAGRFLQQYRDVTGKLELFCVVCGGLWDHRTTDRLIDLIMGTRT